MTNKKNVRGIELGTALQAHLEAIRLLGADGVEQRLKEIREATFQRMAEHKNNSLTWEQICAHVPERTSATDTVTVSHAPLGAKPPQLRLGIFLSFYTAFPYNPPRLQAREIEGLTNGCR